MKFRQGVWKEIVRFVKKDTGNIDSLVELGAGYCDFINQFPAKSKTGFDLNPERKRYAAPGVDLRIEDASVMHNIKNSSIDLVFASNFLEHLTCEELDRLLPRIRNILKDKGKLILLQPNYRLCADHYFDDKTHQTIFSDENITGFLEKYGFSVIKLIPGLLPFSMKSRLPKWPVLVRLYLMSPVKPMAAQMYISAERK
ncbi:SAM-dependent methyltransferase, type 11 [Desulfonema limicola]|uniref:SAM-dependent methyltransferase, type 11 n=2 Tax=Desulfonema limicola TaxID=45656 RepID=A0A975BAQ2_9BACT|nr:SAM-dependent methyltransferase, type 11 [Desulfonema limicola]